jgi:hypothetical protein
MNHKTKVEEGARPDFSRFCERPKGAIPCYLTLGLIIGPMLSVVRSQRFLQFPAAVTNH